MRVKIHCVGPGVYNCADYSSNRDSNGVFCGGAYSDKVYKR